MQVTISELPNEIKNRIPLSLRTYKNVYELDDLPSPIRDLIEDYIVKQQEVEYPIAFDIRPVLSEYGEFEIIRNMEILVVEYFKNYFLIRPGEYPFEANHGCKLKDYLQTKDTELRKRLISDEIQTITKVLTAELGQSITIDELRIVPSAVASHSEYNIRIGVRINDKKITINSETFT